MVSDQGCDQVPLMPEPLPKALGCSLVSDSKKKVAFFFGSRLEGAELLLQQDSRHCRPGGGTHWVAEREKDNKTRGETRVELTTTRALGREHLRVHVWWSVRKNAVLQGADGDTRTFEFCTRQVLR